MKYSTYNKFVTRASVTRSPIALFCLGVTNDFPFPDQKNIKFNHPSRDLNDVGSSLYILLEIH